MIEQTIDIRRYYSSETQFLESYVLNMESNLNILKPDKVSAKGNHFLRIDTHLQLQEDIFLEKHTHLHRKGAKFYRKAALCTAKTYSFYKTTPICTTKTDNLSISTPICTAKTDNLSINTPLCTAKAYSSYNNARPLQANTHKIYAEKTSTSLVEHTNNLITNLKFYYYDF